MKIPNTIRAARCLCVVLLCLLASTARAGRLTALHGFSAAEGHSAYAGLIRGSDGNFYGTTETGGTHSQGSVFRLTPAGVLSTVYSFTGGTDGKAPHGSLVQGTDSMLYGTTYVGGTYSSGTVFKVSMTGTGFAVIHSFTGGADGSYPQAGVIQGTDSKLYGVAAFGGLGYGVLYRLATNGTGFASLYTFHSTDGRRPLGALVQGGDGDFYGTTYLGGAFNLGTVFQLNVATSPATLVSLYNFSGPDGSYPTGSLLTTDAIHFYGTTSGGGATGLGTVFALDTTTFNPFGPGGALSTLYSFHYSDGAQPQSNLTTGPDGQFYGVTNQGGAFGLGTLFAITSGGALTTVHSFSATLTDGAAPIGGLILGSNGVLYGATYSGGATGYGMVYAFQPGTLFTLHPFVGTDGSAPLGGLIQAWDGNLYGTTSGGGANSYGSVFSFSLNNSLLKTLHSFTALDGSFPQSTLMQGTDGLLYGVSEYGAANDGTIFSLGLDGSGFANLYTFSGPDGAFPNGPLVEAPDSSLYGSTASGGLNGGGTLFNIPLGGQVTTLQNFDYYPDGGEPASGLTLGPDGNFYGTTEYGGLYGYGAVFSLTPLGYQTIIHSFAISDGAYPVAGLTLGNDGSFYGSTTAGGANGNGTLFRLSPAGALTTLHSFTTTSSGVNADGSVANALVQGLDGNLYGTTSLGGAAGDGTIFAVSPTGAFNSLYGFSSTDGAAPTAGLVAAPDGNFYGTTSAGGGGSAGTLFEYSPNPAGIPAPGADALNPSSAQAGSAALTLSVTGVSFAPGSTVYWNGSPLATTFSGGTLLTAPVPANLIKTAASVAVTVVNPDSQTSTVLPFTVYPPPPPVINRLSPGSALAGGSAFSLLVNGSGFQTGATLNWNGAALPTTTINPDELVAAVPASDIAAVGSASVTVANTNGMTSASKTFSTYTPPVLFAVSPTGAVVGGAAFTLTVAGANFVSGAHLTWNGASLTATFVSSSKLTVAIPVANIAAAGSAALAVVNPDGHASASVTFPISLPISPLLSGLSPNAAIVGSANKSVNVSGSSFRSGAKVKWNGVALATTFVSPTQLTVTIPAADLNGVGTAKVSVTNPAPNAATTPALTFTILNTTGNAAPTATTLAPATAPAGGAGFTLSVTGTGFLSGATVQWNGTTLPTVFNSATSLSVSVPASDLATVSKATVSVVNPDGQGTAGFTFSVTAPAAPTLTLLNPTSLPAGAPATTITLNGTNFVPGATVNWNGTALQTTLAAASQLSAVVPAIYLSVPGSAAITVTTAGGATAAQTLTVTFTRVRILVGTLTRNTSTGVITAPVTVQNYGYQAATGLQITTAKLGTTATNTTLPIALPDLPAGATQAVTLTLPGSAGASGASATLNVAGSYTNGTFNSSVGVTLP